MDAPFKIVVIEDEPSIAENLIHVLEIEGYQVYWFSTAREGMVFLNNEDAELLVLDVGLPDANGFEVCKSIRETSTIPIIFLTARNDEIDRVVGLEIGADDYVTKPFSPREMVARIKLRIKSLRTTRIESLPEFNLAISEFKEDNFDYRINGQLLGLTAVEFKILKKLLHSSSQVLSREQLMIAADMAQETVYERNIDSHIKAIRNKLKPFSLSDRICTKRSFGYYYNAEGVK